MDSDLDEACLFEQVAVLGVRERSGNASHPRASLRTLLGCEGVVGDHVGDPDPARRGSSQAPVSHHLSVLAKAGLITREQRGKWAWFSIAPARAEFVRTILGRQPAPNLR